MVSIIINISKNGLKLESYISFNPYIPFLIKIDSSSDYPF